MSGFASDLKLAVQLKRLQMRSINLAEPRIMHANLVFVYHMIKASENLLRMARIMARDPRLVAYYSERLLDESGHAEWLAHDLLQAAVPHHVIPREAMLMAGVQYYLLFHVSAASLLGYMAVLECFPMPVEMVEQLERVHGTLSLIHI